MRPRTEARPRRGSALVLVTICLVPMICVMGLALDGGLLLAKKRQSQAGADAAARAAACSLYSRYSSDSGLDPQGNALAAGLALAAANGFANDGTDSVVTINVPPSSASASFAGKSGCAEAIITSYQPRYFSRIFGASKVAIKARAVAQVKATPTASILLTDPTMPGALTLTGGARLTTTAGVQVNSGSVYHPTFSPNGGAVNASNGAYMSPGGGLKIVGNYNIPNWATWGTFFSKEPERNQAAMSDPYASVATPTTAGLIARSAPNPPYGSATINPGIYNGGLTLGGGMTITMNPGLYYMKGGSFTVANGVTLTGTGVTIFLDAAGSSINLQGGTTVTMSAPTTTASGGIPGIVLFQDRANSTPLNNIANGSNVKMTGTIYAPNAAMTIAGGAYGASYGSQYIVKSLNLSNNVNININTPANAGSGVSRPIIAE
ncbi:pilus assembly protein TadG-related protein [Tundrisphaera sp. TA3]|uniref:pilus assembly protein TadG-related protein n=1 Tax=Tundrisphaera sp. TA3 TaxID=3435775 RepID=UPI003EBAA14B